MGAGEVQGTLSAAQVQDKGSWRHSQHQRGPDRGAFGSAFLPGRQDQEGTTGLAVASSTGQLAWVRPLDEIALDI